MFERDYVMRLIMQFVGALRRSWQQKQKDLDPLLAAETLEAAITQTTDIDGAALLSLAPQSMASILRVSGVDDKLISYLGHGLLLASTYYEEAGNAQLAHLRAAQARALAQAYHFDLPDDPSDFSDLDRYKEQ